MSAEEIGEAEVVPDAPTGVPSTTVVVRQGSTELIHGGTPTEQLEWATSVATALDGVIKKQGMRTKVGRGKVIKSDGTEVWEDRYHVNVEGWQTLATFLGIAAVPVWTRQVIDPTTGRPERVTYEVHEKSYHSKNDGGGLRAERTFTVDGYSWEARVEVYKDGALIGAGEAMCSRSEGTWKERDDYALRGMAQTRATSRAIGAAARWIVTLAGYAATPAEEMPPQPTEEPANDRPYGPVCPTAELERGRRAIAFLLNVESESQAVSAVIAKLDDLSGGYLPQIAVNAAGICAAAVKAATVASQAPAGTVAPPNLDGQNMEADLAKLREAGCICPDPYAPGEADGSRPGIDDACPIRGHGIPF